MSIQVDVEELEDAVYVYVTGASGLQEIGIAGRTVRLYVNAMRSRTSDSEWAAWKARYPGVFRED